MIEIKDMTYSEVIEEVGQEFAAALLEQEYNQFIRGLQRTPAPFYPWKDDENYIDYIESMGYRRFKANNEKLYRMEEEF